MTFEMDSRDMARIVYETVLEKNPTKLQGQNHLEWVTKLQKEIQPALMAQRANPAINKDPMKAHSMDEILLQEFINREVNSD